MQLAFTRDIRGADGLVKYTAGTLRDYPKATWKQIADAAGLPLSEITMSPTAAAQLAVGKPTAKRARAAL